MNQERLRQRSEDYQKAVRRLQDAFRQEKNEFIRDSVIQRFEFCYELVWKTLKLKLEQEDIDACSPKETLRAALELGLIEDGNAWTKLHRKRYVTSQTYDEALAEEVYTFVCQTGLPLLQQLAHQTETWRN